MISAANAVLLLLAGVSACHAGSRRSLTSFYADPPADVYLFYSTADSPGGDIKQIKGATVDELKVACSQDPTCVAFTTGGWIKKAIRSQDLWAKLSTDPAQGLYVKDVPGVMRPPLTQVDIPGFQFASMVDSGSSDIGQMQGTPEELAAACLAIPLCHGFNTHGWLKRTVKPSSSWYKIAYNWYTNPAEGLYIRQFDGVEPLKFPGYQFYSLKDSSANDITQVPNITIPDMAKLCSNTPECQGFNTWGWMKKLIKPQDQWVNVNFFAINSPNEGLYVKDQKGIMRPPLTAVDVPGFKFYSLQDSVGGDFNSSVPVYGNPLEFGELCLATPGCAGFNTWGWQKKQIRTSYNKIWWTNNTAEGLYVRDPNYVPPPPTVAPKVPEKIGIWIPFYTWPSPVFDDLINSVEADDCIRGSFKAAVLIGPNNGPPSPTEDKLHREYFSKIASKQEWTTFGYLHVGYGSRPLDEVLKQVDTWLTPGSDGFGDIVQGIWVNQVAPAFNASGEAYMSAIIDRIRFYGKLVALNPGRSIDCKMAAKADFVNYFEDAFTTWAKSNNGAGNVCACSSVTRCIASIHSYDAGSTADDLANVMKLARNGGFEAVFITDRKLPSQYDGLPTFWQSELDGLCKVTINARR